MVKSDFRFSIGRNGLRISFTLVKEPAKTIGVSSRTMDHRHIVFLDYDNTHKSIVENELEILTERYKLSPFYLFSSSNNSWHAISLTKLTMKQVRTIQEDSCCDSGHITLPYKTITRSWVLRSFPKFYNERSVKDKPIFVNIIGSDNLKNEISTGHLLYLMRNYDIPEIAYQKHDGFTKVWEVEYETAKR